LKRCRETEPDMFRSKAHFEEKKAADHIFQERRKTAPAHYARRKSFETKDRERT
jgi:hypothetical protein